MSTFAHPVLFKQLRVAAGKRRTAAPEVLEQHRWILVIVPTFVAAAFFFALALAIGREWPIGVAVALGPIAMMFCFIYLCVSSDSNGRGWKTT